MNMKTSLFLAASLAAVLPLAAQASVVVQQANQNIQQPLSTTAATAHQHERAGVDAANVLGHSAAMTQAELTLMARSDKTTMLPATDHQLDTPKQPSDW